MGQRLHLWISLLLLGMISWVSATAQELRAEVEIHSDAASGGLPPAQREGLRQQLLTLLNQTSWTTMRYLPQERIELQVGLTIRGKTPAGWWQGELTIQAHRPVYHATYKTSTLLLRDSQVAFPYELGQPLRYQREELDHPLTALIAYYVYYTLACDLDSFSPLGGDEMKSTLSLLASQAEGYSDWSGWQALGKGSERRRLLDRFELADEIPLREAWYRYHRLGLDELVDHPEEGRRALLDALQNIRSTQHLGLPSTTLQQIEETKLSELIELFRSSPPAMRAELRELLGELSPRSRERLQALL